MSAKVDSAAVQDGFGIYHHSFFAPGGQWCVVQQGMDKASRWARRYHWLAESVDDFVCEPHAAVQDMAEDSGVGQSGKTTRFLVRNKMNAQIHIPEELGGCEPHGSPGGCHTFHAYTSED